MAAAATVAVAVAVASAVAVAVAVAVVVVVAGVVVVVAVVVVVVVVVVVIVVSVGDQIRSQINSSTPFFLSLYNPHLVHWEAVAFIERLPIFGIHQKMCLPAWISKQRSDMKACIGH